MPRKKSEEKTEELSICRKCSNDFSMTIANKDGKTNVLRKCNAVSQMVWDAMSPDNICSDGHPRVLQCSFFLAR